MRNVVVHLVRHGEVHNPDNVIYGRLPGFGLSARGVQQALEVAEYLAQQDIAVVVSSPLQRAVETAQPLAQRLNLPLSYDKNLIEWSSRFEGRSLKNGRLKLGARELWHMRNPRQPSWGERYDNLVTRMALAIDKAKDQAGSGEVVCFSHELPISVLRKSVQGEKLWGRSNDRGVAHASVTTFLFSDNRTSQVDYWSPTLSAN
ncbi:MAG: histidine phosphatase family protein [Mycobacteriaceae bacterium]